MANEAAQNSVRHLQGLYSMVVALALTIATTEFIDVGAGTIPVNLRLFPIFLSFLVILLPFYHGALRHLDISYIEHGCRAERKGALLGDFVFLFVEGCLFVTLALLIPKSNHFAWALLSLLTLDIIWGLLAHFAFSHEGNIKTQLKWAAINSIAAMVLTIYLILACCLISPTQNASVAFGIGVFGICIIRTIADYALCWDFYYPGNHSE